MITLRYVVTIIIAAPRLFLVDAKSTAKMNLVPFSLELRSNSYLTSDLNGINQNLLDMTRNHFMSFLSKRNDGIWDTFSAISLNEPRSRRIKLVVEGNDDENDSTQEILMASFSGSLSFNAGTQLPSKDEIEMIQWEAFIGQAKLDYLASLRTQTSRPFLQNVTDVKISWTPTKSSGIGTILLAVLVGVVSALAMVGLFVLYQKLKTNNLQNNQRTQRNKKTKPLLRTNSKKRHHTIRDLELAETGSMSPMGFEGDFAPAFVDETDSIRMGRSVVTKDTIDIDTGVDMLAWKHNAMRQSEPFDADITRITKSDVPSPAPIKHNNAVNIHNSIPDDILAAASKMGVMGDDAAPFETDITRISKVSPNKTLVIDLRPKRKGKQKSSRSQSSSSQTQDNDGHYLSRQALSQHNETKFQEHARRYAERKKKMKVGSRRH